MRLEYGGKIYTGMRRRFESGERPGETTTYGKESKPQRF
jgi:hypothetical protein